MGTATASAKTKISQSISQQNLAGAAAPAADGQNSSANGAGNSEKIPEEKEEATK